MVKLKCGLRAVLLMTLVMGLPWFQVAWADLDDGLVAYYPFNGNANDESENGNHGTTHGSASYVQGVSGNALNIQTEGDYVEIPKENVINLNTHKSISVWFKAGNLFNDVNQIFDKTNISDYALNVFVLGTNNYQLRFSVYNGSEYDAIKTSVSPHTWNHAIIVKAESKVTLYLNGSMLDSIVVDSVITKNNPLIVGSGGSPYGPGYSFKGQIDELRFYNRALSENEIKQLYSGEIDTGAEPSTAILSFSNLKPLYNVGEKIVIDLEENVAVNRFNRVDLWVVIEIPGGGLLFMTELAFNPFSLQPQPFRSSLDNTQTTHRVLEFEVLPGLGGDYNFYAVHVEEGKNLMTDSFLVIRSNIAKVKVVLSNK